ncbi:MAG: adenylyl-sulfate kinase, partial [Coleofasciculaceae cyanobacterium]
RTQAISQSKKHQLPIEIIHCQAPLAILRDRLLARTDDVSDATADLLSQQKAATEPFTEAEKLLLKTIDTSENWAAQLL